MLSKRTEISYENSHPPRRPRQLSQALRGAGAARAGPRPLGLRHATSSWKRPSCLTSPTRGRHAAPPGARARRCCASVNAACVQTRALAATRAAYSAPTRPRAAGRFRAPAPAPSPARPAERLGARARRLRPALEPLPYKVDTSRPSRRTNWTRLVPLRPALEPLPLRYQRREALVPPRHRPRRRRAHPERVSHWGRPGTRVAQLVGDSRREARRRGESVEELGELRATVLLRRRAGGYALRSSPLHASILLSQSLIAHRSSLIAHRSSLIAHRSSLIAHL